MPISFRWINQPKRKTKKHDDKIVPVLQSPTHGEKFHLKWDISNFDPETIKTTIEGRLLIIEAKTNIIIRIMTVLKKKKIIIDLPEIVYEHAAS
ncbi:unnamed protein product [Rotaria sp. Silwood1]|nr:unnamed protein product [Rotaria sp. Silwood1]CAF1650493.1 unnamed protein product [Rotaria sp. Silwood1]